MSIGYALGNVVLAAREFENWGEVLTSIARKTEPEKVILKRDGLRIEASVGLRYLVREIFYENIYNPAHLCIEDNDIVVDIGANCGVFTLYAASRTRNTIHAYEPSPANFSILQHNLAMNELRHVVAHRCAVSDTIGKTQLVVNAQDGQQNLLVEHIIPDKIEQYRDRSDLNYLLQTSEQTGVAIDVQTTTLKEIMDSNDLEQIDFLKLDCEGAEGRILYGTPQAYLRRIKKIALEFHDHLSQITHQDLQRLLNEAGFVTMVEWNRRSPLGYLYGLLLP